MENNMAVTHDVRVKLKEMEALREMEDKMKDRQKCNKKILSILESIVENNPMMRFTQILAMLDLDKDRFHEEPIDTLKVINDKLAEL